MSANAKDMIYEDQARNKLLSGINQLADVVAFTLGPKGRNISLEKGWGAPQITNDGNSIVKEIELKDPYENMGASLAKEVAAKIKEKCGDGTTTGTILFRALVQGGVKNVTAGSSPISLKRGIDKAVELIIAELEKNAVAIQSDKDTRNIATVSASGNQEIGDYIASALQKVGTGGVVSIEENKGTDTFIDVVEGMQFDRGFLSTYFCTDAEKQVVEMQNPYILLVDKKINSIHECVPVLQAVASIGAELLIVAEDVEGDALAALVVNRLRGSLKVAAVKSPGFGDRRKAILQDIAVLTGGQVFSEEIGLQLKHATLENLGRAEKVKITKEYTTIVSNHGDKELIASRINQIEAEIASTVSSYDIQKLQERKAKLSSGVAVIRVGAATEPEMKQKKQMFEDSLNSTQAALESGIVPGGGLALLKAAQSIDTSKLSGEEKVAAELVMKACEAPLRQIVQNTGNDASLILSQIKSQGGNYGFNAYTETVEDLISSGVIDPVKVVKTVLVHAASVAGIVLISEALITDAEEE